MSAKTETDIVMVEASEKPFGETLGYCKWFSNNYGYGFITVSTGEHKSKDIFVHHSGVKPINSNFKTLTKGEYINFDVVDGQKGPQAVNVTGVLGGPLMCDHIQGKPEVRGGGGGLSDGGRMSDSGRGGGRMSGEKMKNFLQK